MTTQIRRSSAQAVRYSFRTTAIRLVASASLVGASLVGGTATAVATASPSPSPAAVSETQAYDAPFRVFGSDQECEAFINPIVMFCYPYASGTVGAWYFGETPPPPYTR